MEISKIVADLQTLGKIIEPESHNGLDLFPEYPEPKDPAIQTIISGLKEFQVLRAPGFEEIRPGEPYFSQLVIQLLMGFLRILLLFWEPGSGKTGAFAEIGEYYRRRYDVAHIDSSFPSAIRRTIVIVPNAIVKEEFKRLLFWHHTRKFYVTERFQETKTKKGERQAITASLHRWYTFVTYRSFGNSFVKEKIFSFSEEGKLLHVDLARLRRKADGILYLCDEIHYLQQDSPGETVARAEKDRAYLILKHVVRHCHNSKFVFGSGTPIVKDLNELEPLLNLINEEDVPAGALRDIIPHLKNLQPSQLAQLQYWLRGNISYINSPLTGVQARYVGVPHPRTYPDGTHSTLILYASTMSLVQSYEYAQILLAQAQGRRGAAYVREAEAATFVYPRTNPLTGQQAPDVVGTAAYNFFIDDKPPDSRSKAAREGGKETRSTPLNKWSSDSLRMVFHQGLTWNSQMLIQYLAMKVGPGDPNIFAKLEEIFQLLLISIGTYSAKFYGMLQELHNPESFQVGLGGAYIFFNSVENGVAPFSLALEALGYERFTDRDPVTLERYSKKPRYGVITGKTDPLINLALLDLNRRPENALCEYVRIIIVTQMAKAGINVFYAQQIHVVEGNWVPGLDRQSEDRALRPDGFQALRPYLKITYLIWPLSQPFPQMELPPGLQVLGQAPINAQLQPLNVKYPRLAQRLQREFNIGGLNIWQSNEPAELVVRKYRHVANPLTQQQLEEDLMNFLQIPVSTTREQLYAQLQPLLAQLPQLDVNVRMGLQTLQYLNNLPSITVEELGVLKQEPGRFPSIDIYIYEISEQRRLKNEVALQLFRVNAIDAWIQLPRVRIKFPDFIPMQPQALVTDDRNYLLAHGQDEIRQLKNLLLQRVKQQKLVDVAELSSHPIIIARTLEEMREQPFLPVAETVLETIPSTITIADNLIYEAPALMDPDPLLSFYRENLIVTEVRPLKDVVSLMTIDPQMLHAEILQSGILTAEMKEKIIRLPESALSQFFERLIFGPQTNLTRIITWAYRNFIFEFKYAPELAELAFDRSKNSSSLEANVRLLYKKLQATNAPTIVVHMLDYLKARTTKFSDIQSYLRPSANEKERGYVIRIYQNGQWSNLSDQLARVYVYLLMEEIDSRVANHYDRISEIDRTIYGYLMPSGTMKVRGQENTSGQEMGSLTSDNLNAYFEEIRSLVYRGYAPIEYVNYGLYFTGGYGTYPYYDKNGAQIGFGQAVMGSLEQKRRMLYQFLQNTRTSKISSDTQQPYNRIYRIMDWSDNEEPSFIDSKRN